MATSTPLDRFVAARLETSASSRHAVVLLVGCHVPSLAAVTNGLVAASVVRDSCIATKPSASFRVTERVVRHTPLRATIAVACVSPPADEVAALAAALRLRQHLLASRAFDVALFVWGPKGSGEVEGMVMRGVGRALGEGMWAHALVVGAGRGEEGNGEGADGARQAAVRQAVGEERWRDVGHVAWLADTPESTRVVGESLGEAMVCVVRRTAASFFPQPLLLHSTNHPPAATDFHSLSLLADHNIATSTSHGSQLLSTSSPSPASPKFPLPATADHFPPTTPAFRPPPPVLSATRMSVPPPASLALPVFASLSLSLSASAFSVPLLLPPTHLSSAFRPSEPPMHPFALGRLSAVSAARPGASFQSKCLSPMPVVHACHVMARNGLAAAASPARRTVGSKNQTTAFPDLNHLAGHAGNTSDSWSAAGAHRTVVVWVRDLRLHDHEALAAANSEAAAVLPIYCFDPSYYGKTSYGIDRTDVNRARFVLQSVADMRQSLRARGSDLVVRVGRPEEVVVAVARAVGAAAVLFHGEATTLEQESQLAARLKEEGVEAQWYWGSTLFHVDDLPFAIEDMPLSVRCFFDAVKGLKVRDVQDPPEHLKPLPAYGSIHPGDIPSLQALGLSDQQPLMQSTPRGGEAEALRLLSGFVSHFKAAAVDPKAEDSGSNLYGANFSCNISPWLAIGCLSPRRIFHQTRQLQGPLVHKLTRMPATMSRSCESTSATSAPTCESSLDRLIYELHSCDFFRFVCAKNPLQSRSFSAAPA